jgi:pyruvate/2-oxoglutarate/acetoin dehydrogenase E1 component
VQPLAVGPGCVFSSVRKTGRLLVAQEAVGASGFAAEVALTVAEERAGVRAQGSESHRRAAYAGPVRATLEDEYRITDPHIAAAAKARMD